jgi:hypothetical protein
MILGIAAELSAPPSSPTIFRDVCLFSKTFRKYDVLAISPEDMRDHYSVWFRRYGIWDFVDDIVTPEEMGVLTVEIAGTNSAKLTAFNYQEVLRLL